VSRRSKGPPGQRKKKTGGRRPGAKGGGAKKSGKKGSQHTPTRVSARPAEGREKRRFGSGEPIEVRVALDAMARHRATQQPLDRVLDRAYRHERLGKWERRRAGDLAFAWARQRARLTHAIDKHLSVAGGVPPPVRDRDRAALALAALAADLPPAPPPEDPRLLALVELATDVGPGAFFDDAPPLPEWLERRLRAAYADESDALIEALQQPAPLVLAVDERKHSVDDVLAALEQREVQAARSETSPGAVRVSGRPSLDGLPASVRGAVWPMDDGSQAVVDVLEVDAGMRVLDLCAGGGGKSRLLAARGARVVAVDRSARRLAEAARRGAGDDVACVLADGRSPPFEPGTFDRVLVDAPCSGTGTLRRAPDVASRFDDRRLDAVTERQRALLAAAAVLLRPGGRLVYATCSLLPEENAQVVEAVAEANEGLEVLESRTLLPSREGTDGFYFAALSRR
jgi:16S rRNA (cytosine967-C5)-methyltransferase